MLNKSKKVKLTENLALEIDLPMQRKMFVQTSSVVMYLILFII